MGLLRVSEATPASVACQGCHFYPTFMNSILAFQHFKVPAFVMPCVVIKPSLPTDCPFTPPREEDQAGTISLIYLIRKFEIRDAC